MSLQNISDEIVDSINAYSIKGMPNLLIAQCDDTNVRDFQIARYETLLAADISAYRVEIQTNSATPNLYLALSDLILETPSLQQQEKAAITVLGVEKLRGAARKVFVGNLEFKSTQLKKLPFTTVLWADRETVIEIAGKAPSFYESTKGVFRF